MDIACVDPRTGELLGRVPDLSPEAVEHIVEAARSAQPRWAKRRPRRRRLVARSVLNALVSGQDELCRIAAHDSGKTMLDVAVGELVPTCEMVRYAAARRRIGGQACGVVGVIASDGAPLLSTVGHVVPALVEGNAVVVKLGEGSSWSGLAFADLLRDCLRENRCSGDLVQVATGYDDATETVASSSDDVIDVAGVPSPTATICARLAASRYALVESAVRMVYGRGVWNRSRAVLDMAAALVERTASS